MKTKSSLLGMALLSAMALGVGQSEARASDPVGVYAFVDKVVLEPSEGQAERIQIWGGFALAEGYGETYAPAKRGYMYFTVKPGQEEVCRKEWSDLKTLAGSDQFVAFASRHKAKGTVRKASDKPEKPDVYPTGFGLTKIKKRDYPPINDLAALKKKGADTPGKTASAK
ncbi:MAG TPA: hypothetical protein VK615_14695 [Candidatus Binatia bacterium]|nr:hypothetical protein [Candidatus Binatia bacterium]